MIFYAADQPTADAGKSIIEQWGPLITAAGVTIAALIAFAVAIANRRQTEKHWRITSRRERFTTIATQLADHNPAVRTAGVYAMEALTNDWLTKNHWYNFRWTPSRRAGRQEAQACVNVLCAYLRLPYTPPPGAVTITKQIITTRRGSTSGRGPLTETHHEYRHDDKQVRTSIIDCIGRNTRPIRNNNPLHQPVRRLSISIKQNKTKNRSATAKRWDAIRRLAYWRVSSENGWSDLQYDFAGAELHNSIFRGSIFNDLVLFTGATFHSRAYFKTAIFRGMVSFEDVTFKGTATFYRARFDSETYWQRAKFLHWADFEEAVFSDAAYFRGIEVPAADRPMVSQGGANGGGNYDAHFQSAYFYEAYFDNAAIGRGINFRYAKGEFLEMPGIKAKVIDVVGVDLEDFFSISDVDDKNTKVIRNY